jgi:hypothetical protein
VGFVAKKVALGAGFLRVFRFSLPILIPSISSQSPPPIIWGWYNRPVVAAVPSRLSLTPLRIKKKIGPKDKTLNLDILVVEHVSIGDEDDKNVRHRKARFSLQWRLLCEV